MVLGLKNVLALLAYTHCHTVFKKFSSDWKIWIKKQTLTWTNNAPMYVNFEFLSFLHLSHCGYNPFPWSNNFDFKRLSWVDCCGSTITNVIARDDYPAALEMGEREKNAIFYSANSPNFSSQKSSQTSKVNKLPPSSLLNSNQEDAYSHSPPL